MVREGSLELLVAPNGSRRPFSILDSLPLSLRALLLALGVDSGCEGAAGGQAEGQRRGKGREGGETHSSYERAIW